MRVIIGYPGGFEFNTRGEMRGTPNMHNFYKDRRSKIASLSTLVDTQKPIACGCEHELRLAAEYGTSKNLTADNIFVPSQRLIQLLCDAEKRGCNALCAHVENRRLVADPLGSVLEKFDDEGLLEEHSWRGWHTMMSQKIQSIDRDVQSKRFNIAQEAEQAVVVGRERQEPLVQEIEEMKTVLRRCIATALQWIDRYNQIESANDASNREMVALANQ